jgi:hypothetical protein
MIKLLDILENKILVPLRSKEERSKNYQIATQKKVQQYMKDGGKGDLDLNSTPITSLPSGLSVGGDLYLSGTPITSLPSGLSVGGDLNLSFCENLTSLPPGLSVGGDLYLSFCKKLTSLPSGLSVGGDLSSSNTKITSLPPDLKVGGNLRLYDTPLSKLHTAEQIEQMVPGIKGYVFI